MRKLSTDELNRISVIEFKETQKIPVILILDNLRSLSNIGSIFRTADAFIIEKILLTGITATPPHREIQKTALGATESVDWQYFGTTIEAVQRLKADGIKIFAVEQAEDSVMLDAFSFDFNSKCALIFGNEVKGVDEEAMQWVDGCIEIPQFGTKHSLNVSITAGIVIWEVFQQFQKKF
jgi:tRNA G18 (ribose-2'-O)-methylase SpoU